MSHYQDDLGHQATERLGGKPPLEQYYSLFVPGLSKFVKYSLLQKGYRNLSFEKVSKTLGQNPSQRKDIRRTLIGFQKTDQFGYKLERKCEYEIPLPYETNNFEKGHSTIPKKTINRKFKGPLYNDAGKICVELIDKYPPLESFKLSYVLEGLSSEY